MKKVYIKTYGKGNMHALYDYYSVNYNDLSNNYKIDFVDLKGINKRSIKYVALKIREFFKKYDLILSDYPSSVFKKSGLSLFVNHGYGTKKTPSDSELNNKKVMRVYDLIREHCDYIITLSERDERYFLKYKSLYTDKSPRYLPLGIPRNDFLFKNKSDIDLINELKESFNLPQKSNIILYAPTWRDNKEDIDIAKIELQLETFILDLDRKGWIFLYRPHYLDSIIPTSFFSKFSNVQIIDSKSEPDTQKLLLISDALITDYSSIFLDFLILDRPIFYWVFDASIYSENRGLEFNLEDYTSSPGEKVIDISDLSKLFENNELNDRYQSYRQAALNLYITHQDERSAERIWSLIDESFERDE